MLFKCLFKRGTKITLVKKVHEMSTAWKIRITELAIDSVTPKRAALISEEMRLHVCSIYKMSFSHAMFRTAGDHVLNSFIYFLRVSVNDRVLRNFMPKC